MNNGRTICARSCVDGHKGDYVIRWQTLRLPTVGMRRSIQHHNIDLNAVCDWIEGNALFEGETISIEDAVDQLVDNGVYEVQDYARTRLGDAWDELARRAQWMGRGTSIKVVGQRVIPDRTRAWFILRLEIC